MTREEMMVNLERLLNDMDPSTRYTVKTETVNDVVAFYGFGEDDNFGNVICTSKTYDAYMAMEDGIETDKEMFYKAFYNDAIANGFDGVISKNGEVRLRQHGYGPYDSPVMTMTTGLGTMVVSQYGERGTFDDLSIDLIKNGRIAHLALVGVDEEEDTARVYAYDEHGEATQTEIPLVWGNMALCELTFKMSEVTENHRYSVYVVVQDQYSTEWFWYPFEYGTDDIDEARRVYRLLIGNREKATERCRRALAMTEDEFKRQVNWLEVRFVDWKTNEYMEEPEAL